MSDFQKLLLAVRWVFFFHYAHHCCKDSNYKVYKSKQLCWRLCLISITHCGAAHLQEPHICPSKTKMNCILMLGFYLSPGGSLMQYVQLNMCVGTKNTRVLVEFRHCTTTNYFWPFSVLFSPGNLWHEWRRLKWMT